jgi:inosose dehydratase
VPQNQTSGTGPRFAVGNAIFGQLTVEHLDIIAAAGFPGIEPYRGMMMDFVDRPRQLKELLDERGLTICTISNGGPGMSCDFIDPDARVRTIADHVAFTRDVLKVFGCTYFKINMGARPKHGTTDAELQTIANTINELGRATDAMGVRISPHPHIWGPIERPHEVERLLALTDPAYVSWIPDTAQLNLGGGDPVALIVDHYDRIAAVHWKDSRPAYRGYTGPTPTQAQHQQAILYKDLGTGGVDIPRIWEFLRSRDYRGWITLDLDPPRPAEGEGTAEEKLLINRAYLKDELRIGSL